MFKLSIEYAQEKQKLVEEKASRLGHKIVWSEYREGLNDQPGGTLRSERLAVLKIVCVSHSTEGGQPTETTYHNYLRARNGLQCCGKASVSEKLMNRVFSEETKQKMSNSMKRVQATRPRAKDYRDSFEYDKWRKDSQELGKYTCQITGVRPKALAVHHLFSMHAFKSIMYNSLNSVTLDSELHDIFHKIYGFKKPVTIHCFITFLEDLRDNLSFRERVYSLANPRSLSNNNKKKETQISNPSFEQSNAGSETRVYDPTWIMELHECMVERRVQLEAMLKPDEHTLVLEVQERVNKMTAEQRTTFANFRDCS